MERFTLYAHPKLNKSVVDLFLNSIVPGVFIPCDCEPELVSEVQEIRGEEKVHEFLTQNQKAA